MDQVLKTRTISGVIFGVIVIGLLTTGKIGIFALLSMVLFGATFEYLSITKGSKLKQIIGFAIIATLLLSAFTFKFSANVQIGILGLAVGAYLFLAGTLAMKGKINHHKLLPVILIIYPSLSLLLPVVFKNSEFNNSVFWISIISLIWASDSFAYLVGRKLGKHKLFERISPKKTWEGSIGAGILTILSAFIIGKYFSSYPIQFWLWCGFTIWVFGTIGDLYESSIKRAYDVKDSGNILPGHGGFLDRFDSFIFVIPFIIYLLHNFKLL